MKTNIKLTICTVLSIATLSGCSESATLSQGVDSFNSMVNQVTSGIQEGVESGLGGSNNASKDETTQVATGQVTDWTPYLSSMQQGCEYPDTTEGIPAQYQGSIQSVDKEVFPMPESDELVYTYNLKNAVAFGHPIQKIEYLTGYEWSHLKVIFKNSNFTALRPSFRTPVTTEYPITNNNANGYEADFTYLKFDTTDNSIVCGFGL